MENLKIDNFDLNSDIEVAKAIIDGKINNIPYRFSEVSPIYKTTNENISHYEYMENLKNKNHVLSVIGSGDQIINSILFGSNDIVGVDISTFPKYFLALKLVAIRLLSKTDYLEYFYGVLDKPFLDKYYKNIRDELDNSTKLFWDTLYNDYGNNLYNSHLFNSFRLNYKSATMRNPFLQDNYYDVLKRNIKRTNLELLQYNMFDAKYLDYGCFDLILLSNIIDGIIYNNKDNSYQGYLKLFNIYKKFLSTLPLSKNGVALTYNILNDSFQKYFTEKNYYVYPVIERINGGYIENEILIYKKVDTNRQFVWYLIE